ncbi:unnamed protein product [Rangifer tarandus platyrhynchus]|uniref:Uncharacterized protein n=3 Tax=Rangifer tarandus platyrhynchus TaxID=3082113 RepID=A0ACB0F557_RANTA|nr:unnamed protein product [Rangifer tarandus platyrhynchus]CAI9707643.1 unnamed protein product [Rangifer tarandus platyrhynchus]
MEGKPEKRDWTKRGWSCPVVSMAAWKGRVRLCPFPASGLDGGSSPPLIPCWLQAVQGVNVTKRGRCPEGAQNRGASSWSLNLSGGTIWASDNRQGHAATPRKVRHGAALRRFPRWESWSGKTFLSAAVTASGGPVSSLISSSERQGETLQPAARGLRSGSQQGGGPLGVTWLKAQGTVSPGFCGHTLASSPVGALLGPRISRATPFSPLNGTRSGAQLDGARGPVLANGLTAEEKEPQFQGEAFKSQRQRLQMVQLQTGRASSSWVLWDEEEWPLLG